LSDQTIKGIKVKNMNWYIAVLKKYVVFSGRATRSEYWYFVLFSTIISMVLIGIDVAMGTGSAESTMSSADGGMAMSANMGVLSGLYSLAVLLPSIGVAVRRLHDTDHSAWWIFIALIPIIGGIVLLIFLVKDSTPGENQYGPNPKNATL
jgi:uncharacterized membrane protein YhaH (DUF805 family)